MKRWGTGVAVLRCLYNLHVGAGMGGAVLLNGRKRA